MMKKSSRSIGAHSRPRKRSGPARYPPWADKSAATLHLLFVHTIQYGNACYQAFFFVPE
jgi:hypothetical protein